MSFVPIKIFFYFRIKFQSQVKNQAKFRFWVSSQPTKYSELWYSEGNPADNMLSVGQATYKIAVLGSQTVDTEISVFLKTTAGQAEILLRKKICWTPAIFKYSQPLKRMY